MVPHIAPHPPVHVSNPVSCAMAEIATILGEVKATDPKILVNDLITGRYDANPCTGQEILSALIKIQESDFDEQFCFKLLKYLMESIEQTEPKTETEASLLSESRTASILMFFQAIQHMPSKFFNMNIDITAQILLKAYEFVSLKSDDPFVEQAQIIVEDLLQVVVAKVDVSNKSQLETEVLTGSLMFSSQHQYDEKSLRYYLLREQN